MARRSGLGLWPLITTRAQLHGAGQFGIQCVEQEELARISFAYIVVLGSISTLASIYLCLVL